MISKFKYTPNDCVHRAAAWQRLPRNTGPAAPVQLLLGAPVYRSGANCLLRRPVIASSPALLLYFFRELISSYEWRLVRAMPSRRYFVSIVSSRLSSRVVTSVILNGSAEFGRNSVLAAPSTVLIFIPLRFCSIFSN
jgi:hypothetical protein